MKKTLLLSSLLILSPMTFANTTGLNDQGFFGPSETSVKAAKEGKDDQPVTLTGYITASLGDEMYTFSDGQDNISVEIDNDKWHGIKVTPETKVTITGEIDEEWFNSHINEWFSTKIDVDRIQLAIQ
ncbi:YgiW/YdeI family stress tolerance OB fold protein [Photobacterium profundum]|uniref:Uncharacterized protein n=1 Tax=Photobacterium profundum (strain SS9) TaxID=298386 RepID=Q6LGC1_PHOPR|nr:NirD/YgiW/YdeI family stress tolerance protein [Photobacterium profundum]CAG23659.1 conserved hypothetical protein [Photobacterium profundum SS9]